jgi:uncharacterized membrane protein
LGRKSGFNLDEIDQALAGAGVTEEIRLKVRQALAGTRKPGRKPEPDDDLLICLAQYVTDGHKPYAAATAVTKAMPETEREAVRGRIYKKYRAKPEHWQERARQARMTEEDKAKERRLKLEEARRALAAARRY